MQSLGERAYFRLRNPEGSSANRDPQRRDDPDELMRGKHVCAGAPLASVEVRVGVADLSYEPSFIVPGLAEMQLKLTPSEAFAGR